MMPFTELLQNLRDKQELVTIRRDSLGVSDIRGYIEQVTQSHLLVLNVDYDVCFSGFIVLRVEDVTFLRWGNNKLQAWDKVLSAREKPQTNLQDSDLATWADVCKAVAEESAVISIYQEAVDDDSCFVGRNVQIEGELVRVEDITNEGVLDGIFAFPLKDITRVDFAGNYEQALLEMAE